VNNVTVCGILWEFAVFGNVCFFKIIYLFMFLNCFNMLISKIIFKNKKNYFNVFIKKNTLNNNYYSFFKYIFTSLVYSFKVVLFFILFCV
jgi:hypothetical protein